MLFRAVVLFALTLTACGDKDASTFPETVIVERGPTVLQWTYEELGCDTPQDGMMEGAFSTPPSTVTMMKCGPGGQGTEACFGAVNFVVWGGADIDITCGDMGDDYYVIVSYW